MAPGGPPAHSHPWARWRESGEMATAVTASVCRSIACRSAPEGTGASGVRDGTGATGEGAGCMPQIGAGGDGRWGGGGRRIATSSAFC